MFHEIRDFAPSKNAFVFRIEQNTLDAFFFISVFPSGRFCSVDDNFNFTVTQSVIRSARSNRGIVKMEDPKYYVRNEEKKQSTKRGESE